MKDRGRLYIVATPIGNPDDITLRALKVLRSVDVILCEELRQGSTLLKRLEIETKELIALNEHNEAEIAMELVIRMHQGEHFALISDGGSPVFSDPGAELIRAASETGVTVVPVPGASSLMAALSVLDFRPEKFVYGGFLPRDPNQRRQELQRLRGLRMPVVLMDTPYRLGTLLEDVVKVFGKGVPVTAALNLTQPDEQILRGPAADIRRQLGKRKAEFILIVRPGPQ